MLRHRQEQASAAMRTNRIFAVTTFEIHFSGHLSDKEASNFTSVNQCFSDSMFLRNKCNSIVLINSHANAYMDVD